MIVSDGAPSRHDSHPQAIVILVQDGLHPRTPRLEAIKESVAAALADLGTPLVVAPAAHLHDLLEHVPPEPDLLVLAETSSSLQAARQAIGAVTSTFCLLVVPTSFAHPAPATPPWARELESVPTTNTIFLTDSPLSRAVIENQLRTARVDVRVIQAPAVPPPASTTAEDHFAEMKTGAPSTALPQHSGSNWDFTPRQPQATPKVSAGDVTCQRAENIAVVAQLLAIRKLAGEPMHVGILGHKLSFIDELARDLARASGSTVELDEWTSLSAPPDRPRAERLVARSNVLIGEWGRPNNVWLQRHARADKRLIVRVHRYEVTTPFPRAIDMDRFDAGVVIVPWVGRALVQRFDWPAEKLVYIPNYVNTRHFRREKLPGAEFTLGIVGITPDLKRLDLALDLLAALRAHDLRYSLRIRGALPTEHIHWATNPAIAEQWETVLFRLRTDPVLRSAVHFDPPGRDMATWLEQIGIILSTSDLEGSHVALAEGMASGALPIARPWPGIRTLWPAACVHDTLDSAVQQVLRSQDRSHRDQVLTQLGLHPSLDQDRVLQAWWDLVRGDRDAAQSAFGPVDWTADWYDPVEL